jgi:hypothetical protein
VPANAVTERQGAKVVFSLEDQTVRMRNVSLGPPVGAGFELLEGPPAGTRVIREPPANLADGQVVKEKSES